MNDNQIQLKGQKLDFQNWYYLIISYFYFGQGYSLASLALLLPLYIFNVLKADSYSQSVSISVLIIFPWYFKVIFGLLSDNFPMMNKRRRKPYLMIATVFSVIGWMTLGIQTTPNMFFILSGISLAIGSAMADSVFDAQVVELTPIRFAGRVQGFAWGSRGLGIGITGITSTVIVNNYGWQMMFRVSAIFGISMSIVVLILPEISAKQPFSNHKLINVKNSIVKSFQIINIKEKIIYFLSSGISLAIVPILAIMMEREFNFSISLIGIGTLLFAIGSFFGAVFNGALFDKKESRNGIIILFSSLFGIIILSLSLVIIKYKIVQMGYMILIGICAGAFEGYQLKIIQETVPRNYEGTAFAIYTGLSNIGQFALGGLLIISISELFGISLFFTLQLTLISISISLYYRLKFY